MSLARSRFTVQGRVLTPSRTVEVVLLAAYLAFAVTPFSGIAVWMIIVRRCSGDISGVRRRVVWFSLGAVMTRRRRSESSLRQ
jgi:hypothetical protein